MTVAVLYDGQAQAEVELNDSGVWVTNRSAGMLGRFNASSQTVDGTLLAGSSSFDVQQDAQRVLLTEPSTASASAVDPAHLELGAALAAPTGSLIASGGATAAVLDVKGGRLWVTPFESAASLDPDKTRPTAQVPGAKALTVSRDGTVFAVGATQDGGSLYRVPTLSRGTPQEPERSDLDLNAQSDVQVTAVGDDAVVLDRSAGVLVLPGGGTARVDDAKQARLQQPSPSSDHVLVATTSGLVSQPLRGGDGQVRRAGGLPAAPVQVGGCDYGAWSLSAQVLRDCAGTDFDVDRVLDGVAADSPLEYRVNRDVVVLNDLAAGTVWMAAEDFRKVDDWEQSMPQDAEGDPAESQESTPEQVDQVVADRSLENRPPVAHDDEFGARPGRTTVLDVLGNDVDPDGDVIVAHVGDQPEGAVVTQVMGGLALQMTAPADATGDRTFTYTVSDGRGGSDTASALVRLVGDDQNTAPEQTGEPVLTVARGGAGSIDVLPYFRDPEGDDLVLSSATTQSPADEVRFRPDGRVELRDGGESTGRKIVALTVSDERGMTVEGRLLVDVVAGQSPPVAVNDHVTVLAGQAVTVRPLANDWDPDGDPLRLVSVSEQAPATITPNYATGDFRFTSAEPGSYDLAYQVSDGPSATTGLVRVDVLAPPTDPADPIAVADRVLLPAGGSALVDVLANDSDPAGGVLVVQRVDVPDDAGITVAVLAHQVLRVTETRRLPGPVVVTYTVSNGERTAQGQVRVIPIPEPDRVRPPDATADEVVVHTGDVVTIPVLANDSHPDGLELTLVPDLVEEPEAELGTAFVAQNTVRFKAGGTAGTAHLVYEVRDPHDQRDSAQVTIRVVDVRENAAPQLPDVEARVLAGGTVRIVPRLDGVDPDGDLVTIEAIASPPAKGSASVVDGAIEYTAGRTEVGLDVFTYRVLDTRGASAVGTVRVGIARPAETNQPPVAVNDEVRVRPGRLVAIDAIDNDSDPDGDQIGLVPGAIEGGEALDAQVAEGMIVVRTPDEPRVHTFYYGVEDTYAARAVGAVTVDVDPQAALQAPIARDDVVAPADVSGSTVTVPVLANDSDPDGRAEDLVVTVDGAATAAGVTVVDGSLVIPLAPRPQVITYTATDVDGLTARAFVRVPRDGTGPRLRDPLDLTVEQGASLDLDLTQLVVVQAGRTPSLTAEDQVSAVPGAVAVHSATRLVYTAPADFVGQASVTLEVTDGARRDDPDGRTAMLTVPVTVTAPQNLPPRFDGAPALDVAAGEESAVDVARFVTDPDGDPITVAIAGDVDGLTTSVSGTRVVAQAAVDVPKGSVIQVPVTVSDGVNPPVAGQVAVTVVASTRPLAVANDDAVEDAHQGVAVPVEVLRNDGNPFPGQDLTVVGAQVETGQGVAQVDGDRVVVTPDADFVGRMVVRYRVQDATGDPDREVEGRVSLAVLGRPETPRAPSVEEVRSRTVVLSWEPPVDNGSAITGYTVTASDGATTSCPSTTCTIDGLTNNVVYRFTVQATNDVGTSDASPASPDARPDESPDPPAAPTLDFGDASLAVSWTNAVYADRSPIQCVDLEIFPAPTSGVVVRECVDGTSLRWTGLENGTSYTVRARARNQAPEPSQWGDWSAPMVPAAPPDAPTGVTATHVETALGGQVRVTWTAPEDHGDDVRSYHVTAYEGGTQRAADDVTGTSAIMLGLSDSAEYTFTVTATNKAGTSPASAASNSVTPYGVPDTVTGASAANASAPSGQAVISWTNLATSAFHGTGGYYQVRIQGDSGARTAPSSPYTYTGLSNGTAYRFEVRACNAHTCQPQWTTASGSVTPYTTPGAPSATYGRTGATTGRFTVNGPSADGGNAVQEIQFQVSGSHSLTESRTSWPFTVDVGNGYGQTHTITVRARNAAGWGPWSSAVSGRTDPNPDSLQVSITRGGSADTHPNCVSRGTGTCWWVDLHVSNAPPDSLVYWGCWTTEPWSDGRSPRQYDPAWSGFNTHDVNGGDIRTDANGNAVGTPCAQLSGGEDVWVVVRKYDGTQNSIASNHLRW
ncbi:Ig-like domain-containing protein [Xylanimonas ulmi]